MKRSKKGATLVELCVTLVLVAIFMGMFLSFMVIMREKTNNNMKQSAAVEELDDFKNSLKSWILHYDNYDYDFKFQVNLASLERIELDEEGKHPKVEDFTDVPVDKDGNLYLTNDELIAAREKLNEFVRISLGDLPADYVGLEIDGNKIFAVNNGKNRNVAAAFYLKDGDIQGEMYYNIADETDPSGYRVEINKGKTIHMKAEVISAVTFSTEVSRESGRMMIVCRLIYSDDDGSERSTTIMLSTHAKTFLERRDGQYR